MAAASRASLATAEGCPSEDAIVAFVEAALSPEEAASIHAHVDVCGTCRLLLAELGRLNHSAPLPTTSASLPMVPAPGVIVGNRYRLERLLGAGGMGTVWAAVHLVTHRAIALKLLKGTHDAFPATVLRRFLREARAASAVDHPNIVRILDVFDEGGTPVLVMDLLEGEPLSRLLQRRGALDLSEIAAVMTPVLSAVAAAHAAGIVHRDLKPDNIFLVSGKGGEIDVRVLDFGVAKMTAFEGQAAASGSLTRTGEVVGTPYYMSPEQFYGESDIDAKADVWALGVVLYECLSGRRPFSGGNLGQVLKHVTSTKHTRLDEVAPHVPAEVARLVERMLERDRAARPNDLRAVAEVIQRAARPAPESKAAIRSATRRRVALTWSAVGVLAIAATAGGWAFVRRDTVTTPHIARSSQWTGATAPPAASSPSPPPRVEERIDEAGPIGTWHLNCSGFAVLVTIRREGDGFRGTFRDQAGWEDPIDEISWDQATGRLVFRRRTIGVWQWYAGDLADGVFVGRFSSIRKPDRPLRGASFFFTVTGWKEQMIDRDIVPRVFAVDWGPNSGWLRLDRTAGGKLIGRAKAYSAKALGAFEEPEDDLAVTRWDGTNLEFRRPPRMEQTYMATLSGDLLSGEIARYNGTTSPWSARRTAVLSYGTAARSADERAQWQARVRGALTHLTMAGNPVPLSRKVELVRSALPPIAGVPAPHRDDDSEQWPQAYRLDELRFTYTLPNPYDAGRPLTRRSHGYLAVPAAIPSGKKLRAVVALNDHGGSAWQVMSPHSETHWYGDSFARRGFVVLALDVSHRNDSPSYKQSRGDDEANGNTVRPSIKPPGFAVSDWEEAGERAWDAMRALDHLQSLPYVDPDKVIVTGLALGGEVATAAAALDPRFAMAIVAGYSPDLTVLAERSSHPCWRWTNAEVREYIDASDLFALVAPRPLIFQTGKEDFTVSPQYPAAAEKQVARRIRAAYGDEASRFVHYLHDDANRFHVGGRTAQGGAPQGVTTPNVVEPESPSSRAWQSDTSTTAKWATLYDAIDELLPAR